MRYKVDALGKDLNVNDYVVFSGSSKGLSVGKVEKIANVKILINSNNWNGGWHYPKEIMIISENEFKIFQKR